MGLLEKVTERLSLVRDPETGMDVVAMKLVRNLEVGEGGEVKLTFRPSSVYCPLAYQLGIDVKEAVRAVPEVRQIRVDVEGFVYAEQLERILNDMV